MAGCFTRAHIKSMLWEGVDVLGEIKLERARLRQTKRDEKAARVRKDAADLAAMKRLETARITAYKTAMRKDGNRRINAAATSATRMALQDLEMRARHSFITRMAMQAEHASTASQVRVAVTKKAMKAVAKKAMKAAK